MTAPPQRKILRVGLIQNDNILQEQLLRRPQTVTVGRDPNRNTLVVPACELPDEFRLFRFDGDGYTLQFHARTRGRISLGERIETFEQLRTDGIATPASQHDDVYQLRLDPATCGRIRIGETTVLFQFVSPPAHNGLTDLPAAMKPRLTRGVNRPLAVLILLSALAQVGFLGYVVAQDWPVPREHQRAFQQNLMAQVVDDSSHEPDEQSDSDQPGDELQDIPDEPDSPGMPDDDHTADETSDPDDPSADTDDSNAHDLTVEQRVERQTVLAALNSDNGERTTTQALADDARDIDTEFDTPSSPDPDAGPDDQRLAPGGNPGSDNAIAGGGEVGPIGGNNNVTTGDRQERQVEHTTIDPPEPPPGGDGDDLDTGALTTALNQIRPNIESCYQNHLREHRDAAGTVRVFITVSERSSRGVITDTEVLNDEVAADDSVGACISRVLETSVVPALPAPDGESANVTIPYHFSPGS